MSRSGRADDGRGLSAGDFRQALRRDAILGLVIGGFALGAALVGGWIRIVLAVAGGLLSLLLVWSLIVLAAAREVVESSKTRHLGPYSSK